VEGVTASIFHVIFDLIWPGWNYNPLNIFLLGVLQVFTWYIILKFWEKKEYKGSFEWMMVKLVKVLAQKDSNKLSSINVEAKAHEIQTKVEEIKADPK
jgi:hypothetical protein